MNHKVAFSFADGKTLFFPVHANEILLDAALRLSLIHISEPTRPY